MAHKFGFLPRCHHPSEPWPRRFFAIWSLGRGWGCFWEKRGTRPWTHRRARTNLGLYPHWGSGLISHSHSIKMNEFTLKTTFIPHSSKWEPWSQSYPASCGCNPWWRHLKKRLEGRENWEVPLKEKLPPRETKGVVFKEGAEDIRLIIS